MKSDTEQPKPEATIGELAEQFQRAREDMRQLDEALGKLGSPRGPERRLDRAPPPMPAIPIFNPTILSY